MRTAILAGTLLGALALSISCGARTELPGLDRDGEGGGVGVLTGGGDFPGITVGPIATATTSGDGGGGNDGGGGQSEGGGGGSVIEECDPDLLFIYLVTSETDLYRFDPSTLEFTLIGNVACPTEFGGSPFSMAVSRGGRAYVVYNTGELFRVNVKTAACSATDWFPRPIGDFGTFGMGYALDDDGSGESLYVADINFGTPSAGLGSIETTDFDFGYIGPFSENPGDAIELTSADDGELYGYFLNAGGGGTVVRIDKDSGDILEAVELDVGAGGSLAFAYWNGDFYIFNGDGSLSTVTRYRPSEGLTTEVATLGRSIVGAGVTTCDPDDAR